MPGTKQITVKNLIIAHDNLQRICTEVANTLKKAPAKTVKGKRGDKRRAVGMFPPGCKFGPHPETLGACMPKALLVAEFVGVTNPELSAALEAVVGWSKLVCRALEALGPKTPIDVPARVGDQFVRPPKQ